MTKEQGDLMARVLDMTETELRAAMLFLLEDVYSANPTLSARMAVEEAIDAAYNELRRTGIPKEVMNKL